MPKQEAAELNTSLTVAAAEAFIKRKSKDNVHKLLLGATKKYWNKVCAKMREFDPSLPEDHSGH